jgi:hypothetical protein
MASASAKSANNDFIIAPLLSMSGNKIKNRTGMISGAALRGEQKLGRLLTWTAEPGWPQAATAC